VTHKDVNKNNYFSHQIMVTNLIDARDNYLEKSGKSIMDNHIYKILILKCIGNTMTAEKRRSERYKTRKEKGKVPVFRFNSSNKDQVLSWNFPNTSGNAITDIYKLKFIEKNKQIYYRNDIIENKETEDVDSD
jgi:hypothetical protein